MNEWSGKNKLLKLDRDENRNLYFWGQLILTVTTHSLHRRLQICLFYTSHRILIPKREYGSIVIMLKINWHVNHLLQLILTHTIATVEDIYSMPVAFHTDLQILWKQEGKESPVQSSLVCLFAVICCSMGLVNLPIVNDINTAALHKAVNVLLLKCWKHWCLRPLIYFYDAAALWLFCKASSKANFPSWQTL